jgi:hypothetical protein
MFKDISKVLMSAIIYYKSDVQKVFDSINKDFGDVGNLKDVSKEVEEEVEKIKIKFESGKIIMNEGYFFEFNSKFYIGSAIANSLSLKEPNKTFLIAHTEGKYYKFSLRRQDGKFDMNSIGKKLVEGFEDSEAGGHFKASGGYVLAKDAIDFKKKAISF